MPLAVVLVVDDDPGQSSAAAPSGTRRNAGTSPSAPGEHDALLDVAVARGPRDDADLRRRPRGWEGEQGGEARAQIVGLHPA